MTGRGGAGAEHPPGRTAPLGVWPRAAPAHSRRSVAPSLTPAARADSRLRCLNRNLLPRPPPGPGRQLGSAGKRPARRPPWPRRGEVGAAAAFARTVRSSAVDRAPGPGRRGGRGSCPPPARRSPARRSWRGPAAAAAADRAGHASVCPRRRAGLRSTPRPAPGARRAPR